MRTMILERTHSRDPIVISMTVMIKVSMINVELLPVEITRLET